MVKIDFPISSRCSGCRHLQILNVILPENSGDMVIKCADRDCKINGQHIISSDEIIFNYLLKEYINSDVVMSEFLRNYPDVPVKIKRKLLKWSADDEFMEILDNGEIVRKEGV